MTNLTIELEIIVDFKFFIGNNAFYSINFVNSRA